MSDEQMKPSPENVAGECQTTDCPEPEAWLVEFRPLGHGGEKCRATYCDHHAEIVQGCFCTHGCRDKQPVA